MGKITSESVSNNVFSLHDRLVVCAMWTVHSMQCLCIVLYIPGIHTRKSSSDSQYNYGLASVHLLLEIDFIR